MCGILDSEEKQMLRAPSLRLCPVAWVGNHEPILFICREPEALVRDWEKRKKPQPQGWGFNHAGNSAALRPFR
jgi:hypothetical protein